MIRNKDTKENEELKVKVSNCILTLNDNPNPAIDFDNLVADKNNGFPCCRVCVPKELIMQKWTNKKIKDFCDIFQSLATTEIDLIKSYSINTIKKFIFPIGKEIRFVNHYNKEVSIKLLKGNLND